jgi:putative alpha-1,2-mannosidase
MGFYPLNPSNGAYVFGSPLFDEVDLNLGGGNSMKIISENNSDTNIYIQEVILNGTKHKYSYITHKDLVKGGELRFVMGSKPNLEFGKNKKYRPESIVY